MRTPQPAINALLAAVMLATAAFVTAEVSPALAEQASLFAQLGGQPGIDRIVDEAVKLYVTDPRIADQFDNIEFGRLRRVVAEHLCSVTDGPCSYHGRSMAAAHKGMHLDRAQFNAATEDFQTAMQRCGIPYWIQNRVLARLAPMQRDIVTR